MLIRYDIAPPYMGKIRINLVYALAILFLPHNNSLKIIRYSGSIFLLVLVPAVADNTTPGREAGSDYRILDIPFLSYKDFLEQNDEKYNTNYSKV